MAPQNVSNSNKRLRARQFYALVWKDFVVHKRHFVWSLLELTIPVLICALAILSSTNQGKPKLEPEQTFDQDDYAKLFDDLTPAKHSLLIAPNTSFTRALVDSIDEESVRVELVASEAELVRRLQAEVPVALNQIKKLIPDDKANLTIAGVVVDDSSEQWLRVPLRSTFGNALQASVLSASDASTFGHDSSEHMLVPLHLQLAIRATNFRLAPDAFPKKSSLGPFLHGDHYINSFFMASQLIVSRAYIRLVANQMPPELAERVASWLPAPDNVVGQRMPYPRFVAHRRLRESTLSTFVVGAQKQKPFVLTLDFCVTIGFLVTSIFLAKRLVDERKSRIRDMLTLVGVPNWLYYLSHLSNTLLLMLVQCLLIVFLFDGGHSEAPLQNIAPTLLYAILASYALQSVVYVLALSSFFKSSTRAIICTALLWLGTPEVIERVVKLNAGVIESAGFVDLGENWHLLLSFLSPNYALRLANRLLTEADIYGEFYNKKAVYGEYRAIWQNVNTQLPLYHSITLLKLLVAMLLATGSYAAVIFVRELLSSKLTASGESSKSRLSLLSVVKFLPLALMLLIFAPFRLLSKLLSAVTKSRGADSSSSLRASSTLRNKQSASDKQLESAAYANDAFASLQASDEQQDTSCRVEGNNCQYFEVAPKMLTTGLSIQNVCKTYATSARTIEAVKNVSLDLYYSQILGKFCNFLVAQPMQEVKFSADEKR